VIDTGYMPKSLGCWCQVQYKDYCLVFAHLREEPKRRTVLKGEVIAYTGDTGFGTGAHLHLEGWHKPMDRSKLNRETWKKLTFDVITKI
jgi:murein DD-endopeptidase MepM/ murein hydrolase activator NlpD